MVSLLLLGCPGSVTPPASGEDSAASDRASAFVVLPPGSHPSDTSADTGDTGPVIDRDMDDDGFIDEAAGGDDCDDNNAGVYPGAPEMCDDADQDCDGDGWLGADCSATQAIAGMGVLLAGSPWGLASIVRDVTADGVADVMDGYYRSDELAGLAYWAATEIPENPGYFPDDNSVAAFYEYTDLISHYLDFGDVDGDGYNDVGHVPGGVYGYSTLLFRGPVPTDGTWVSSGDSDYSWDASPSIEWSDCWSCGAITGDWNGDGLGDLALAAWDDTEPEEDGGLVVYWGGNFGEERVTLAGNHLDGLDALGDVTGDGTDDMAIQDPSQGSRATVVAWIDGADLSLGMDLMAPIDVAFATVIDDAYENSAWSGVRDWDGDGLVDPEAVIYPGGGDINTEAELVAFGSATSKPLAIDDAIGGYDLTGTALEGGARGQPCAFAGTAQLLYQRATTWALFETPTSLPPRHSPLPDRILVFEGAYGVYGSNCGDVTGDGAQDLVFGAREDWMDDRAHIRIIPGWEIPWDDDTYWP